MATVKVTIRIDKIMLAEVDRMVTEGRFPSRSKAFQEALQDKLEAIRRERLAEEPAKPNFIEWQKQRAEMFRSLDSMVDIPLDNDEAMRLALEAQQAVRREQRAEKL